MSITYHNDTSAEKSPILPRALATNMQLITQGRDTYYEISYNKYMRIPDSGPHEIHRDFFETIPETLGDSIYSRVYIYDLFQHLNLDMATADFFRTIEHSSFRDTSLHYSNVYNPVMGMLVGWRNQELSTFHNSPTQWCDIVFPTWHYHSTTYYDPPNSINYVVQPNIDQNQVTQALIHEILSDKDLNREYYWNFMPPRGMGGDATNYFALLQSPAGIGTAQMLLRYGQSMSWPEIGMITLLYHRRDRSYSLILQIGNTVRT